MNMYQIIFLCAFGTLIIVFLYEKITGLQIAHLVFNKKPILEALKLLVKACGGVFGSPSFEIAYKILSAAIDATVEAEDMWKSGEIEKDKRPEYCETVLEAALEKAGIKINGQIRQILSGIIALTCMLLPHTKDTY